MNIQQYILTKIAEEASEIAQRALKASQFGINQVEPGQTESNAERLRAEVFDLGIWHRIAVDNGVLTVPTHGEFRQRFSAKLGTIIDMAGIATQNGQLADGIIRINLP